MKRFFCTVCRKVKRVQKWPRMIQDADNTNPQERIGECNRHAGQTDRLSIRRKVAR